MAKIIKLQSGGYMLPNYIGASVQNVIPNISNAINRQVDPYSRYQRDQQAMIQNSQAWQGLIGNQVNMVNQSKQLAMQERNAQLNESLYKLKEKSAYNDLMKQNQEQFNELLALDDNLFLESDQEKYQKLAEESQMDDAYIAGSIDYRDSDAMYAATQKKKVFLSGFKNSYRNKNQYLNTIKELDAIEKRVNLDALAKTTYLDIDKAVQYKDDLVNIRTQLDKFRYNGDQFNFDDETLQRLRTYSNDSFIKPEAYKDQIDNTKAVLEAQNIEAGAEAKEKLYQANNLAQAIDQADLYTKEFNSKYPNPTIEQRQQLAVDRDRIIHPEKYTAKPTEINTIDEYAIASGRADEIINARIAKDKAEAAKALSQANDPAELPPPYLSNKTTIVDKNGNVTGARYGNTIDMKSIELATGVKPDADGKFKLTRSQLEQTFPGLDADKLSEYGVRIKLTTNAWFDKNDVYEILPDYDKIINLPSPTPAVPANPTPTPTPNNPQDPANFFK